MNIVIDGSFVAKKVTGVQRFNWEVMKRLVKDTTVNWYIAVSKDTDITKLKDIPNIKIIQKGKKNNKYWQFFTLARIARKLHARVLCMSNFTPLFKKDYIVLHDVTFLDKEGHNRKLWSLMYKFFVGFRFNKHRQVFTVSNFSKSRIKFHYKKYPLDNITVVGSGGDHWDGIVEKKPDVLKSEHYFLSVGSTTPNKNFKYVVELAKKNTDKDFYVVGRIDDNIKEFVGNLPNVIFTGYVTNEELAYLYSHTDGFILPSTYEGFGLPPLEAVFCGCEYLLLSNIDVFKETYQSAANYFDPNDYINQIDLNNLVKVSDEEKKRLIETFNWTNVSNKILIKIKETY